MGIFICVFNTPFTRGKNYLDHDPNECLRGTKCLDPNRYLDSDYQL